MTGPDAEEEPSSVQASAAAGLPMILRTSDRPLVFLNQSSTAQTSPSGAGTSVVYSSLGTPTWQASLGYQANGTFESGDFISPTRPGVLASVEVGMSSWACESGGWSTGDCQTAEGATFTHPITLNLYAVDYSGPDPSPGAIIASVEQTFEIRYRPSADPACPDGRFFDDRFGACVNGYNTSITFDLSGEDVVIPSELMLGVEYNTQSYGPDPIGAPGPYNSLNVALQSDTWATIGQSVLMDDLLWEAVGVPFGLYQFPVGSWPFMTAAEFEVTNQGFVTGGGWFTSPPGAYSGTGDEIVVNASPDDGWFWNAEPPFVTAAELTDEEASIGTGGLHVPPITNASGNAEKFILRYTPTSEILISDLDAFSVDFLIDDNGSNSNPDQFYINVYTLNADPNDGSWYDCRFDYVATSGSTTNWTTLGFTGATVPTARGDNLGGGCPATLGGMEAGSSLLFISVNLGDTSGNDTGIGGYFDNASMILAGSTVTWDFEPPFASGRASFGFNAMYKRGANVPTGNTQFTFQAGGLNFHSSSYDWLVVNQGDSNAQFKGQGTINGSGNYTFMLWAGDKDPDTFRIRIWNDAGGVEDVVYDNGVDQEIEGGQIVIHGERGKR